MSKLTFQEILNKLKECGISASDLEDLSEGSEDVGEFDREAFHTVFGNTKVVDVKGGVDGGDYSELTILFEDHNVYVQINGYYNSYYGTEWNPDIIQVEPQNRTVTIYQ